MTAPPRTPPAPVAGALATAIAHHQAGRLDEAIAAYRRFVRLEPNSAEAYLGLGNALAARGELEPAIASYRRALALAPDAAIVHNSLAFVLEAQGRFDEALAGYRRAVEIDEHPAFCANFAHALTRASRVTVDEGLRRLVARSISLAWARPADLARPAIGVILGDPRLGAMLEAAARAWPERPDADALFGASGVAMLGRDPLLVALLENAQVCEPALERFLTSARHALLARVAGGEALSHEALVFACALARQCFLNDYVFDVTDAEAEQAQTLRDELESASPAQHPAASSRLALAACYFPLACLEGTGALARLAWPTPVHALLVQQVEEPREERAIAGAIPRLTPIVHDVSRRVQQQYEESPYPRWVGTPIEEPLSLETYLRRLFPAASLPAPGTIAGRDILVAGCGTGQESVGLARMFPASRVLAVDLSLASLAYASRKTRALGLANVEYAQADILALDGLERRFDMISSVGVLHHMADPLAGARRLAALLRPGAFMQVGLYSESGRRDLAAARALIAERGYTADPRDIRRCRRELLDSGAFPRLVALRDLYGLNECRDLLFHVQEHRFTLPGVRAMVEALALEFVGLAVPPAAARAFAQRFPAAAPNDLDAWHAFEAQFPDTFAGMYLFWVRKPASA